MNLNTIITGPARIGLALGRWVASTVAERGSQAIGIVQERLGGDRQVDDAELAHRVETEIFSSRRVARGKVDVEVVDGVVWLRGEARTPELVIELEERAAEIPGVERVENLVRVAKPKGTRAKPKRTASERRAKAPAAPAEPAGASDDTAITRKVETELFREGFAPKGKISVSTAEGVVYLRGEADTAERIGELESKAAAVPEVRRVENELRVAEQPETAAEREWTSRRFNADETTDTGEPTPRELADRGEGRQPAPLGAPAAGPDQPPKESPAAPFPSTGNGHGNPAGAPGEETAS
jgi:osmotically-inducible protein OsmY